MSAIKGDFTGFTFNGIHSSELGLTRVSDGSRYSETLFPTIQEKTVQIPGKDGTFYFGSFYTSRAFNISVAFEDLTEEQFVKIRRVFGDKKIHDLIFDETPYKIYRVKSTGSPNLKYVCFNKDADKFDRDYQDNNEIQNKRDLYEVGSRSPYGRVYKGEGQLNFIAYYPFARSRFKYIDEYTIVNIPEWGSMDTASADDVHYNLYDWANSIGLKRSDSSLMINGSSHQIDQVEINWGETASTPGTGGVAFYNPGDFPTDFNLYLLYGVGNFSGTFSNISINYDEDHFITIEKIKLDSNEYGIRINSKLNLIEGLSADIEEVTDTNGKNPFKEHWYYYNNNSQLVFCRPNMTTPASNTTYYKATTYYPSGNIYNYGITSGDFFKLPITDNLKWMNLTTTQLSRFGQGIIEYDYLFY